MITNIEVAKLSSQQGLHSQFKRSEETGKELQVNGIANKREFQDKSKLY
jgi:hypothetical protein